MVCGNSALSLHENAHTRSRAAVAARLGGLSSSAAGVYFLSSTTPAPALFGAPSRNCFMNLQFHHPARLAAWALIIGQLICGAACAQRRAATLASPKPDKSDTASAAE